MPRGKLTGGLPGVFCGAFFLCPLPVCGPHDRRNTMSIEKEVERQLAYLAVSGSECIPDGGLGQKLRKSLETGVPLRIKQGIDPTSPHVHIGHMVPFSLMRRFQDLGHTGVLIIGDVTAGIGDPTGRNAERPPLSREDVSRNAETYTRQIFTVVNRKTCEVHRQSDWFDTLDLAEVIRLMSSFSLAQLMAHETFRKRMESGDRLSFHELLYPLLQAYDSVFIRADVELGGTDQRFNILCGRDLMRSRQMDPQIAMFVPLLPGADGEKMSKSRGNDIPVLAEGFDQFCRIMRIGDDMISLYRRMLLSAGTEVIGAIEARIAGGEGRAEKLDLAEALVARFHGSESAASARDRFLREVSGNSLPADIPEVRVQGSGQSIDYIVRFASGVSLSEARRLVVQGGVRIDGEQERDPKTELRPRAGGILVQVGKRQYFRIVE